MLILDIDYFKAINDQYGHDIGDQVLRELGTILLQQARRSDVVARFGGEEFTLLLPDTNLDDALQVATRLHKLINKIQTKDKTLTVSIGIAVALPQHKLNFEQLFKLADQALYQAKAQGRNCTRVAEI